LTAALDGSVGRLDPKSAASGQARRTLPSRYGSRLLGLPRGVLKSDHGAQVKIRISSVSHGEHSMRKRPGPPSSPTSAARSLLIGIAVAVFGVHHSWQA